MSTSRRGARSGISRRDVLKGVAVAGGTLGLMGMSAANQAHAQAATLDTVSFQGQDSSYGKVREYWIQADSFERMLVRNNKDEFTGMTFSGNQDTYWAVGYRAYSANWGEVLHGNPDIGPNLGIPGPILRGQVGDTIRVHFRNNDQHYKYAHSMHPHGVKYNPANDGAWVASDPNKPGAAIEVGQSYTYTWTVEPSSVGTWVYHDHSRMPPDKNGMAMMEIGAELGLFGIFALTDDTVPPVDREFVVFLHDLYQDDVPALSQDYDCFNGQCYLGNTPTFVARVGERVRWRIGALGKEFHVFHVHGHRWQQNGRWSDTVHLGPSMAADFDYVEDNPGTWLYHCHVTDHMMGGMVGRYIVNE